MRRSRRFLAVSTLGSTNASRNPIEWAEGFPKPIEIPNNPLISGMSVR